jgi:AcrR family transcriptional regulator
VAADDTPRPPWRTAPAAPRAALTQDLLVDAALRIIGEEGLDALSMRRVAQEFATGPATLYAHIANKEELLDLVMDRVAQQVEVPDADPARWEEQVKEFARSMYGRLVEHGDVARLSIANIPIGPASAMVSDRLLAVLLAGGLSRQHATWAIDRLMLQVCADAHETAVYRSRWRRSGIPLEAFIEREMGRVRDYMSSLPADRFPHIAANLDVMFEGGGDERFEFGLDLFVRGLASLVPAEQAGQPARRPPRAPRRMRK